MTNPFTLDKEWVGGLSSLMRSLGPSIFSKNQEKPMLNLSMLMPKLDDLFKPYKRMGYSGLNTPLGE